MLTAASQPLLCALLRYRHYGNFAEFRRACDLAHGPVTFRGKYAYSNLLLAAHVSGLIEVSLAKGRIEWWAAFKGDVNVHSPKPKSIGTTHEWFAENCEKYRALISDQDGTALILGKREDVRRPAGGELPGIFERSFINRFPPYHIVERQVCIREPMPIDQEVQEECFDECRGQWISEGAAELEELRLFRSHRKYYGLSYYIQSRQLGLRFRVTHPEWAFVVAYNVLPWSLDHLLSVHGDSVIVQRAVRLPGLILRFLFASADAVLIGRELRFNGVDPHLSANLRKWLSKQGM